MSNYEFEFLFIRMVIKFVVITFLLGTVLFLCSSVIEWIKNKKNWI